MGNFVRETMATINTQRTLRKMSVSLLNTTSKHVITLNNTWVGLVQVTDRHTAEQLLEPKSDAIKPGSSSDASQEFFFLQTYKS